LYDDAYGLLKLSYAKDGVVLQDKYVIQINFQKAHIFEKKKHFFHTSKKRA